MNLLRLSSASLLFAALASTALAQTVVPGAARPELMERKARIQDERPEVGGVPVLTAQDEGGKPIDSGLSFTLKSIRFEGLTAFSEQEIESVYRDKLGTKITVGELNKIVADITAYYRNKGFILTRAVLPPQKIAGGDVKVRIVEGFVSEVMVKGDVDSSSVIHDYAAKIKASRPLNAETLERYLLLMEDLPGVRARAVLQPSPNTPGASVVVVDISRKPVEASASLDNRGSRFLGPIQLGATLSANNLIGLDEQTQLRVMNSIFEPKEIKYFEVRHEEQLGTEGTKAILSASYVKTQPGANIEILDIDGSSSTFSAGLTHPLIRSRQTNWFINGDFTYRRTGVSSLDINLYEDKLSVFTFGTSYDFVDSLSAINRLDADLSKGVSWGTDNGPLLNSRGNGKTSFTKLVANVSRLQPIDGPWSIYGAASGQISSDPLLAAEEFAIGGAAFGSAYDTAEITGDDGIAARLELQYSDATNLDFLQQYQVYGFYDVGRVWNEGPLVAGESAHVSLASAGVGARVNLIEELSASVEVAQPLTKKVSAYGADGSAPRVFFNLQYRY